MTNSPTNPAPAIVTRRDETEGLGGAAIERGPKEAPKEGSPDAGAALSEAPTGPRTEFVLNELRSALSAMTTFFGMDEDEASAQTFEKARQALNYAEIVMRPLVPWERQSLEDFRACVHRWHEKACAKGYDGVEAMCDLATQAPAEGAEPVANDDARDAARYRWLRDHSQTRAVIRWNSPAPISDDSEANHEHELVLPGFNARGFDAAVDAAASTALQPKAVEKL